MFLIWLCHESFMRIFESSRCTSASLLKQSLSINDSIKVYLEELRPNVEEKNEFINIIKVIANHSFKLFCHICPG